MTYQGRGREVRALLDCDTPSAADAPDAPATSTVTATGDLRIERNLLCGLSQLSSAPQAADRNLAQARRLAESSASPLMGEVLRTEALAQLHRNQLPQAAALFAESREAARTQQDAFLEASDLLNLGFVALERNRFDEALTWMSAAEAAARPIDARPVLEAALGNIGWAYFNLGDFEKALANFQLAEAQAKAIGTHSAEVDWMLDAGLAHFKLGNFAEAKKTDERALVAARALNSPTDIINIEANLAFLLLKNGDIQAAKAHTESALEASAGLTNSSVVLYPQFLEGLLAEHSARPQDAESLLLRVHDAASNHPDLKWEIENALASYFDSRDPQRAETWYQRSLQTFESQRSSVQDEELKLSFFGNGDTLYGDYAAFLIRQHRSNAALGLLNHSRARTLEEGLGMAKTGAAADDAFDPRAAARQANAVILFYSLGDTESYLWAIDSRRIEFHRLPKRADIDALVKIYQKDILRSTDPLHDANQSAKTLFRMLIAPAASLIPAGAKVLLVPDGSLHALNFETLIAPGGGGDHYWIDDVSVTDSNSLRIGVESRAPPLAEHTLLLIGNPISADPQFDALANAPAEIELIQDHFAPEHRRVLAQDAAVPSAYVDSSPDTFSYIHFVAHGTASRLSPLDSAVVLSAPAQAPGAYKLYARDIVQHPLHAQLVTISACYGSGLRAYAGEGLVGLSWAFLRAGAHHVISALWEASDASTPQLMDELYSGLDRGEAPDVALRNAKLLLMRSSGPFRKPLYWGAFQLYGGA